MRSTARVSASTPPWYRSAAGGRGRHRGRLHRIEALPRFAPADHEADSRLQAALIAIDRGRARCGRSWVVVVSPRVRSTVRPKPTATRIGVQAVPVRGGARYRSDPGDMAGGSQPATADARRGLVTGRRNHRDGHDDADRPAGVQQPRRGTAVGVDRHGSHPRLRARFALGPQPAVPSVVLGSGTVTLEHLTAAYAAFANQGVVPQPAYIRRVERADGTLLFSGPGAPRYLRSARSNRPPRFSSRACCGMWSTPAPGPGSTRGIRRTGWREDWHDRRLQGRLVRGVHPELAAGVWIGFDQPRTIIADGYASELAAPLWAQFMKAALADRPAGWLAPRRTSSPSKCARSLVHWFGIGVGRRGNANWTRFGPAAPRMLSISSKGLNRANVVPSTSDGCPAVRPGSPARRCAALVR